MAHILMTGDAAGGVWTYCMELAGALAAQGVRVTLATMGPIPGAAQREEARQIPGLTLYESACRLEWMDDPWDDVERAGQWLLQLERDTVPDVIHLNGYVHGALPWHAPVLLTAHSCVLSWWRAVKGERAPGRYRRYREAVAQGLRAARLVVSPTAAMLGALEREYGALPRTAVIPNARSGGLFPPQRKEPFIFFAGRLWDEAKNAQLLDEIAHELPWPVYAAGDASHPDGSSKAPAALRALGVQSSMEISNWLGRAAIYALPARYEPFGLSALEAALAGCALVLGDIGSLREVWGDAALYAGPDDSLGWVNCFHEVLRDEGLRAGLSQAARKCALRYCPATMAQSYISAYSVLS
jgi:glycosyltransferase involved in cell wall biosynthesis